MAYEALAAYYDAFNKDADYNRLSSKISALLAAGGVVDGIVADLGCGTGELTLRLAAQGYDMIAIDASPQMLCELQNIFCFFANVWRNWICTVPFGALFPPSTPSIIFHRTLSQRHCSELPFLWSRTPFLFVI